MNVIGHNDVSAYSDAVFVISSPREAQEDIVHRIRRQQGSSPMSARRYEEDRIGWKEAIEMWRNLRMFVHGRGEHHHRWRILKQRRSRVSHSETATEELEYSGI
jgi:hypothetical protein